jgi:Leucine-rich repeat (LRR) protein
MKTCLRRALTAILTTLLLCGAVPLTAHAATDLAPAFTDANFLLAIRFELSKWGDAPITAEDCAKITTLMVDNQGIKSLAGIEHLTNLSVLDVSGNELTALDFSSNPKLTRLGCGENPLTSLNVRQNPELWQLNCQDTDLPTLDVSQNSKLKILFAPGNPQLSGLDLTNSPLLAELNVAECGLTTLNLSQNTKLESLYCQYNALSNLNLSNLDALESLECSDNNLASLNLSGCPYLMQLACENNRLTALDVSQNTVLMWLACGGNEIGSLNLLKNQLLIDLRCSDNKLTRLDLSENVYLQHLECADNRLVSLSIEMNEALVYLDCAGNAINEIDLGSNKELNEANLAANKLSALNIQGLNRLRNLDVSNNKLPSKLSIIGLNDANLYKFIYDPQEPNGTDITAEFTDLKLLAALRDAMGLGSRDPILQEEALLVEELRLNGAGIEHLHGLEYFSNLTRLSLMDNALTELDASAFSKLKELDCSGNQLTALDVSKNAALEKLWCSENKLERLDVTKNGNLVVLNCADNQIVTLDMSRNGYLQQLVCAYNLLSALDMSQNTQLNYLDVRMNFLPDRNTVQFYAGEPDTFRFDNQRNLSADMSEFFTDSNFLAALLDKLGKSAGDPISATELQSIIDLDVSGRGIKSLAGLNFLTNLVTFDCSDNKLTGFDVAANAALLTIDATMNWMSSPDDVYNLRPATLLLFNPQKFSGENVTAKFADQNLLAAVRAALGKEPDGPIGSEDCAQTDALNLQNKGIKNTAGIEYFTGLKSLNLSGNELETLSLAQNAALTQLDVSNNHLQSLNLAPNRQLQSVNVTKNFMEDQSALRFSNPAPQNVTFTPQNDYVETPATCTTGGYGTWTCSHSPAHTLVVNPTRALGHDYKKTIVKPTLASEGYTINTCSRCGDSYMTDQKGRVAFDYDNNLTLRYHENTMLFSDADHLAPELTWRSSNEKVLKIDNDGLIKFPHLARGESTITGSAGGVDYVTVKVTVKWDWWQWLLVILLFGWIWY